MAEPAPVLIAEDEPIASMALRAQVEALGHTVAAMARTGDEAAALMRCVPAELAIFDMKMPGLTGLDAAQTAFDDAPTPVLLLTGFSAADLPDPVPEPPIFAVVTKPIGLDDLRKGIRRAQERFQAWLDRENTHDDVRRARLDRKVIAEALGDPDARTGAAAIRFLERARHENTHPAELARRIGDGPLDA